MTNDSISDKDKILFHQAMREVTPLKPSLFVSKAQHTRENTTKSIRSIQYKFKKKQPLQAINHTQNDIPLSNYYSDTVLAESILSYGEATLPPKRFHQLKKGQLRWQAVLDLHGKTTYMARDALCSFIKQQQSLHRCILIIHGKGGQHQPTPILKNHVNHWLKQLPQVLAFHSAQPKDGGCGALYVLLRRPVRD